MKTLTFTTGAASSVGVTMSTLNDDGSVNEDSRNAILGTTAATTATVVGGTVLNNNTLDKIYEKYATSYIESMSDEELETALAKLDLLEGKINDNIVGKSL